MVTDSLVLLALAAYVAGLATSREHLSQLWDKVNNDVDMIIGMVRDLFREIMSGLNYVGRIIVNVFLFLCLIWYELIVPMLAAISRFIQKWWWVPVAIALAYLFIWGAISFVMSGGVGMIPDLTSLLAFLAAVMAVFAIIYALTQWMQLVVWVMLALLVLVAILVALGVIVLGAVGLAILLGALIGLLFVALATFAESLLKFAAMALSALVFTLVLLVPSCGQGDGVQPTQTPKVEAKAEAKEETSAPPYTVVAQVTAKAGDGCISLMERLGVTEARSKELFGNDRLSWCVANSHSENRLVYWHSDPKRWEAPRVCMNEVPGKVTQPERWMLVIWPEGTTGIIMPPDSRQCTPRP